MATRLKPLKYYTKGPDVLLSHAVKPQPSNSKFICAAISNRMAMKIAANMNLMESRTQKAHEIYMCGAAPAQATEGAVTK